MLLTVRVSLRRHLPRVLTALQTRGGPAQLKQASYSGPNEKRSLLQHKLVNTLTSLRGVVTLHLVSVVRLPAGFWDSLRPRPRNHRRLFTANRPAQRLVALTRGPGGTFLPSGRRAVVQTGRR